MTTTLVCPECGTEYVRPPDNITETKVVFPEGLTEFHLLTSLVSRHGIDGIQVVPAVGGKEKFREGLEAYSIAMFEAGVEAIVLVADNDDDPPARLDEMADALREAETAFDLPVPGDPWKVEATAGQPSTAILMLPEAGRMGTAETLLYGVLSDAYESDHQLVDGIWDQTTVGSQNLGLMKQEKARMSALLATTCVKPPCHAHHMWQSNRKYDRALLDDVRFTPIVDFLRGL